MSRQQPAPPPQEQDLSRRSRARLLYVGMSQHNEVWCSVPDVPPCTRLYFITGGSGRLQVGQDVFSAAAGDMVVISRGIPHAGFEQLEPLPEHIVLGVEGLEEAAGPGGWVVLHIQTGWDELLGCLRLFLMEARSGLPDSGTVYGGLLEVLRVLLSRQEGLFLSGGPAGTGTRIEHECALVRWYIDVHYKETLTLDQLAALVHVNKYYLAHAFRRAFGTSPINYLITRRIRESRFLLRETDHTLSQIAQILGFSSQSYFSQCFRRVEGISPLEYRRRGREPGPSA